MAPRQPRQQKLNSDGNPVYITGDFDWSSIRFRPKPYWECALSQVGAYASILPECSPRTVKTRHTPPTITEAAVRKIVRDRRDAAMRLQQVGAPGFVGEDLVRVRNCHPAGFDFLAGGKRLWSGTGRVLCNRRPWCPFCYAGWLYDQFPALREMFEKSRTTRKFRMQAWAGRQPADARPLAVAMPANHTSFREYRAVLAKIPRLAAWLQMSPVPAKDNSERVDCVWRVLAVGLPKALEAVSPPRWGFQTTASWSRVVETETELAYAFGEAFPYPLECFYGNVHAIADVLRWRETTTQHWFVNVQPPSGDR